MPAPSVLFHKKIHILDDNNQLSADCTTTHRGWNRESRLLQVHYSDLQEQCLSFYFNNPIGIHNSTISYQK